VWEQKEVIQSIALKLLMEVRNAGTEREKDRERKREREIACTTPGFINLCMLIMSSPPILCPNIL
jgi:hypothetical protein